VCLSVEAVAFASVETIVLPWPRMDGRCLIFHDRGPTRRLALPPSALGGAPAVGELYAAELATGDDAASGSPLAWPPIDVTAQVRAFTRPA